MVRKTYKYHEISIPQANDPTKTISKDNYISPDHHSQDGMIGFDAPDSTLVSNVLTPIDSVVVVRGEAAGADQIDHVTYGAAPDIDDLDLLWLQKGAEAITLKHNVATPPSNSGPLLLLSQVDQLMPSARMVLLQRQGSNFQEIAFSGIVGNNGILVTDDAGQAIIVCGSVASAVNYLKVTNSATGNDVLIEASGTDTNIGITLTPKGTGKITALEQVVSNIREATGKAIAIAITAIASAVNYIEIKANITANDPEIQAKGSDTNVSVKFVPKGSGTFFGNREVSSYPLTDESSLPVVGVVYTTEPAPYDMKIEDVIAGLTVAGTGAALWTVDILKEDSVNADTFTTIFTTKPTIDASEFTSTTAAAAMALSVTTWEKGRRLQLKIDQLDTDTLARGAKVTLITHATAK